MPPANLLQRARAWVAAQAREPAPEFAATVQQASPPQGAEDLAIEVAAALCRRFEGFYSAPYLCPAGVPTIGFGATHYLDGRRVTLRDAPISREAALALLVAMVRTTYLPAVRRLCPRLAEPYALAAIIDFTFNLGAGALQASTLRKRINAEQWEAVPAELHRWRFAGSRELRGLVLRRQAEADTIAQGGADNNNRRGK